MSGIFDDLEDYFEERRVEKLYDQGFAAGEEKAQDDEDQAIFEDGYKDGFSGDADD
jgi:hypothetical protein